MFIYKNLIDAQKRMSNEEDRLNPHLIGHVKEPTLFELTKRTLRETNVHSPNGYIMAIMGGDICDVSNPYSDLMQAAKFVSENTDDKNTLIVITRSCSDNDNTLTRDVQSENIPVFAKGKSGP